MGGPGEDGVIGGVWVWVCKCSIWLLFGLIFDI